MLNLENLCITQFADLLQRNRRTTLTIKTKGVPISQAMIALVEEKRRRPMGKMAKEQAVILCTTEEPNHVLDKWIEDGIGKPYLVSRPPIKEE